MDFKLGHYPDLKSIDGLEAAVSETEELISNHKTVGGIIPLAMVERAAILSAVFHLDGDVIEAARRLQVGKTTLYRKLKEWGMGRTADGLPDP